MCNDVYQVANKVKLIAAEALRGVSTWTHVRRESPNRVPTSRVASITARMSSMWTSNET